MRVIFPRHLILAAALALLSLAGATAQERTGYDFSQGGDLAASWSLHNTPGAYVPALKAGRLRFIVSSPNPSQRTFVVSKKDGIDPFAGGVAITVQGLALDQQMPPSGSAAAQSFFLILGKANGDAVDSYFPSIEGTFNNFNKSGALGLFVEQTAESYWIKVADWGRSDSVERFELDGPPTGLVWKIEGGAGTWTLKLDGATLKEGGDREVSGRIANFSASAIKDGCRLAMGAMNLGGGNKDFAGAGARFSVKALDLEPLAAQTSDAKPEAN